jgi:hypothetical protein
MYNKNNNLKVFSGKIEEWRTWKDEALDNLDDFQNGVKKVLEMVEKDEYHEDWKNMGTHLYKALKRATEGEARKVVTAIANEDGWRAWRELCRQFEAGVKLRLSTAMQETFNMNKRAGNTPQETRKLIPELEQKFKDVDNLATQAGKQSPIDDLTKATMLRQILDPKTKEMTASRLDGGLL